jgi:ParB-like chromosome segregation protein Spo0J
MIHINIKDLHFMVEPKCTNEVMDSIIKIGLKHPVIVIKTTKTTWEEEREFYPFIIDPPDIKGEFYQIRFGHNRVAALTKLDWRTIPCIVCDTIAEAAKLGRSQALWQKQKLGAL